MVQRGNLRVHLERAQKLAFPRTLKFLPVRARNPELQEVFGLRRKESMKFQPVFATKGLDDAIRLKASWCKAGRTRTELTPEQKQADYRARMQISAELWHGREEITAVYLGL